MKLALFHSSIRVCGLQSNFKTVPTRSKAARSISTYNFSARNLKSNILPPRCFRVLPSPFELVCRDKQIKTSVIANSSFSVAQKNYYASAKDKKNSSQQRTIMVLEGVTKHLQDGRPLFENVNLSFYYGAKIGVLGINGSGKSSLMKILAGIDKDYDGNVNLVGDATVGYLAQEPELDASKNVRENIYDGVREKKACLDRYLEVKNILETDPPTSPEELTSMQNELIILQNEVETQNLTDLERKIGRAMDALKCPPGDKSVTRLSGGERRRVALCRLLLQQPDVLLLDEPTNHLDATSVAWLERFLNDYPGTVLAITHDRYFLDKVAEWILEIDQGELFPFKGNYTEWLIKKQQRVALEEKQEQAKSKVLERELEWIRQTPKARMSKNKSRVAAYEKLVEDNSKTKWHSAGNVFIKPGPRLGDLVVEAKGISKSFNDKVLFQDLSFRLTPGAIVGVIGPNGVGKTTLFNIISGNEQPEEGEIKIGSSVELGFVSQNREDQLNPDNTIYEEVSEGEDVITYGNYSMNTRSYLAAFNFRGQSQNKYISNISGGERNRVQLAKMLKRGANLLLLDEPTNDLDVEVLRSLETALMDFSGCAVIISHDRWFLDRIATHILAFEGNGKVEFFEGNYTAYEADRKRRLGSKQTEQSVKYKKIERV